MDTKEINQLVVDIAQRARAASLDLATLSTDKKNRFLHELADQLVSQKVAILEANSVDLDDAKRNKIRTTKLDVAQSVRIHTIKLDGAEGVKIHAIKLDGATATKSSLSTVVTRRASKSVLSNLRWHGADKTLKGVTRDETSKTKFSFKTR